MFRKLYKQANESVTDQALKNKVLSCQRKKVSFKPFYATALVAFAVFALVLNINVFKPSQNTDIETASYSARRMMPVQESAENLIQYTGVLPYADIDGIEIIRLDISDGISVYLLSGQTENSAELIKKAELTMKNIDLTVPEFEINHNNTTLKASDILNNLSTVVTDMPHILKYDIPFTYVLYDNQTKSIIE